MISVPSQCHKLLHHFLNVLSSRETLHIGRVIWVSLLMTRHCSVLSLWSVQGEKECRVQFPEVLLLTHNLSHIMVSVRNPDGSASIHLDFTAFQKAIKANLCCLLLKVLTSHNITACIVLKNIWYMITWLLNSWWYLQWSKFM